MWRTFQGENTRHRGIMPPQSTPSPPPPPVAHVDSGEAKKDNPLGAWRQRRRSDVLINLETYAVKEQTEYLVDDILIKILSQFPAQVLHDVLRHVCKEWYLVIRSQGFTHHHARISGTGIMIQEQGLARNATFVGMRLGRLEICKCEIGDQVWTSCNGLVLVPDFRVLHRISVVNPLTKWRSILPPFFSRAEHYSEFCLAFVEASMEYKVVHKPSDSEMQIAVLTVGVDRAWRHIDAEPLSLTTLTSPTLVTGGYIHWIGDTFVLTLNVESETIQSFRMPQLQQRGTHFLPMGSNLSVVHESSQNLRDIWLMNPETGEWTRLLRFDLQPLIPRFKGSFYLSIIPLGWLVVREVLLFSTSNYQRRCIAYNVRTREIQSFELDAEGRYHFQAHVNSLVRLEG